MKKVFQQQGFFIFSFFLILSFSFFSRPPIYGKLKFILLNTFYTNYRIAEELYSHFLKINTKTFLYSDHITQYSLFAALGINTEKDNRFRTVNSFPNLIIPISSFIHEVSKKENSVCVINLLGFADTWVPRLTGHWNPIISDTARFYEHNGYKGKKLAIILENQLKNKCIVLADKELPWEDGENVRFHSPNMNFTNQQEDVYILQFHKSPNSKVYNILIDVGMQKQVEDKLLDYLAINEILSIDEIFITHPHKDHYSGLWELIKFGIPIRKVWMNLPKKENCDTEIPWGCDFKDILKLQDLLKEKGIAFQEIIHTNPKDPKIVYQDEKNILSVLYASPPVHPNLGNMDTNDLSIIMRLKTNGVNYLFSGDMNRNLSNFLKGDESFRADILKIPHHGTEGVATNEFFDTVGAKLGIVPSPTHLWCSERSARIRNYFNDKKNTVYISGFHGDILFRHFDSGKYQIKTELKPENICE